MISANYCNLTKETLFWSRYVHDEYQRRNVNYRIKYLPNTKKNGHKLKLNVADVREFEVIFS